MNSLIQTSEVWNSFSRPIVKFFLEKVDNSTNKMQANAYDVRYTCSDSGVVYLCFVMSEANPVVRPRGWRFLLHIFIELLTRSP